MQNLLGQADSIQSRGAFYMPVGDGRVSDIDMRDIGRAAAAVLTTDGHERRAYELSGPEALYYAERADIRRQCFGEARQLRRASEGGGLGVGMSE